MQQIKKVESKVQNYIVVLFRSGMLLVSSISSFTITCDTVPRN